jgi:hypothetical protein
MLPRLPLLAYQPLLAAPFLGPLAQRFPPFYDALFAFAGGSRIWSAEERDAFADVLRHPARAEAASRLYRTFRRASSPPSRAGATPDSG